MTEFNKGYWNLEELKIVEWFDSKQEGYMDGDVVSCRNRILEDLTFEADKGVLDVDNACKIVNKVFGDM